MTSKLAKARQELSLNHHIENPTDQQLAKATGLSVEKVILYSQASRGHASLEDPVDSNALGGAQAETDSLADVIEDHSPTADDLIMMVS